MCTISLAHTYHTQTHHHQQQSINRRARGVHSCRKWSSHPTSSVMINEFWHGVRWVSIILDGGETPVRGHVSALRGLLAITHNPMRICCDGISLFYKINWIVNAKLLKRGENYSLNSELVWVILSRRENVQIVLLLFKIIIKSCLNHNWKPFFVSLQELLFLFVASKHFVTNCQPLTKQLQTKRNTN